MAKKSPENDIQILLENDAIEQIVGTVKQADVGMAPFVLVLGAGFSYGLVPTARELATEDLPLWMKSLNEKVAFDELKKRGPGERADIAKKYWRQFLDKNATRKLQLSLDANTGTPVDYAAAYRACFDSRYDGAVGTPAQARLFQRALMKLDQPRLNAAHFLLASLLGVQSTKKAKSPLFKADAAFSRLILTTNFDPFLQTALQAVNRLYVMSDTPELGVGDDIVDDATDAIHLVYVHGSIHRRSQAATEKDIKKLKDRNARALAPALMRHGVIVLGYSGWDDAIVEALAACEVFDHRLYWCGREADPEVPGAFGTSVPDILREKNGIYVKIENAGQFMAQICYQLMNWPPRLLANPIGQIHQMLGTIDLKELAHQPAPGRGGWPIPPGMPTSGGPIPPRLDGRSISEELVLVKAATLEGLKDAEQDFRKSQATRQVLSSASFAEMSRDYANALVLCNNAMNSSDLQPQQEAEIYLIRGRAQYYLGNKTDAVSDWTSLIELPRAPVEKVTAALNYRGIGYYEDNKFEAALADFTQVIEKAGTPVLQEAQALGNRGAIWARTDQPDKALADYSQLIDHLPGAPVEEVAKGLYNRGLLFRQRGETDRALADFTQIIEKLPGVPVEKLGQALADRGWTYYELQNNELFLADTEAALRRWPALDYASFNLGLALLACTRDKDALIAYRRAAEQFPSQIQYLGLDDLEEALNKKKWLSEVRANPVMRLLQSLIKAAPV